MSIEIFMSSRMLVIDDDEASRLLCRTALAPDGHLVFITGSPEQALAILDESPVSLLIVDVLLASAELHFSSTRSASRFQ